LKKLIRYLGPGVITAALVFGPGSLTVTSKLGASFGYQHIWIILVAISFMVVFTEMGARIGIATDGSLLDLIRKKWGSPAALLLGVGIFLITASFQAGNTIGASLAFSELFHTPREPWLITFTLVGLSLLFFKSFYKVLEKLMIALVGLMLVSFFVTLILAKPNINSLFTGLVPRIPAGSEMLSIALVASSFSIVGAFYQGYLVKEKGWTSGEMKEGTREAIAGVLVLGTISLFILVNAAAILFPQGIEVKSATNMGNALQPLYGNTATIIFMLGLFGASFSSLIGNATIGGSLLADGLGLGKHLDSKAVRIMIMLVMVFGATIAMIFGNLPLDLIIFAQAITIILAPLVGFALMVIANDSQQMGEFKNTTWNNLAGFAGWFLLFSLSIIQVYLLFLKK